MKKGLYISLLLLGGFFFLLHSLVPHHHHIGIICFEISHQNHEAPHSPADKKIPENDKSKDKPCCSFHQEVIVPLNHLKFECFTIIVYSNQKIVNTWFQFGNCTFYNNVLYSGLIQDFHFKEILCLDYGLQKLPFGLRAPPIA